MAPKELESDKTDPYKTSFMGTIKDSSVKNIAKTDKYGAGKSKILKSIVACIELKKIN